MAVMELNSYSNSTDSASNPWNYPLYMASYNHIKLQTSYVLIGNSDPANSADIVNDPYDGALILNTSGKKRSE
eukprot:1185523-Prorocentrum_minimum.AAC.3